MLNTARYCKYPQSLRDLLDYGGTHIYMPMAGYHGEKLGRQWSDRDAALFYATVPPRLRTVFRRSWSEELSFITRAARSANDRKVYAKVFLAEYILSFVTITAVDVLDACRLFVDGGLADAVRQSKAGNGNEGDPAAAHLLSVAGYIFDCNDQIVSSRTGEPIQAKHLNNWCYEACVPYPLDCIGGGDWTTPESYASVARFVGLSRFPKSRIRARAWLSEDNSATVQERSEAADVLETYIASVCKKLDCSREEYNARRKFWLALEQGKPDVVYRSDIDRKFVIP